MDKFFKDLKLVPLPAHATRIVSVVSYKQSENHHERLILATDVSVHELVDGIWMQMVFAEQK